MDAVIAVVQPSTDASSISATGVVVANGGKHTTRRLNTQMTLRGDWSIAIGLRLGRHRSAVMTVVVPW